MAKVSRFYETEQLAQLIIEDIKKKGLGVGHRYLTAKEVGTLFGVSTVTAHRAMAYLSEKDVLQRRRKSGTFIGEGFEPAPISGEAVLSCIHVLVDQDHRITSGQEMDAFFEGTYAILPETSVQIHYIPDSNFMIHTKNIVDQIKASGQNQGIILIHSSEQVQAYVQSVGIPAIVYGSCYPGIKDLSWLDLDQAKIGRELTDKALQDGFKKFILVQRNVWRHGDNLLFNEMTSRLGEENLPMGTLIVCSISREKIVIKYEMKKMLQELNEPVAIICRGLYYADLIKECAEGLKLKKKDYSIYVAGPIDKKSPYIGIKPEFDELERAKMLINNLIDQASKRKQPELVNKVDISL